MLLIWARKTKRMLTGLFQDAIDLVSYRKCSGRNPAFIYAKRSNLTWLRGTEISNETGVVRCVYLIQIFQSHMRERAQNCELKSAPRLEWRDHTDDHQNFASWIQKEL
jgi:hypothetical protein